MKISIQSARLSGTVARMAVVALAFVALGTAFAVQIDRASATSHTVFTSGAHVDTWDPIFPADPYAYPYDNWVDNTCVPSPAVGLDAAWTNPHKASVVNGHPWQGGAGFTADWINAWNDRYSRGDRGYNWTKYSTDVSGTGDFVLNLLADNCSWIYIDGTLVGFQDASLSPRTYPVTLSGTHVLEFIIFDGGGQAGGMYRLETNEGTIFPDDDGDGLTNPEEHLYGTDPNDADSEDDGVSDGDEVAGGSDPLDPASTPGGGSKSAILIASGIDNKGTHNAPGLKGEFNPKGKGAEHAGKKK
jgi:hypothetical protein